MSGDSTGPSLRKTALLVIKVVVTVAVFWWLFNRSEISLGDLLEDGTLRLPPRLVNR